MHQRLFTYLLMLSCDLVVAFEGREASIVVYSEKDRELLQIEPYTSRLDFKSVECTGLLNTIMKAAFHDAENPKKLTRLRQVCGQIPQRHAG
jgi:hypothetical protein